jgi:catechol 2,3-dioxygenase-like lactoylglutathione lyase family enzyme
MSEQATPTTVTRPTLSIAYPQVFVSDIAASCRFFTDQLGFEVAFLYGEPPFYGQVRRGRARLNVHHVDEPVFHGDIRRRELLLACYIPVSDVDALYAEYQAAGVRFAQPLTSHPWDATDFIVEDPDGNLLGFSSPTDLQD